MPEAPRGYCLSGHNTVRLAVRAELVEAHSPFDRLRANELKRTALSQAMPCQAASAVQLVARRQKNVGRVQPAEQPLNRAVPNPSRSRIPRAGCAFSKHHAGCTTHSGYGITAEGRPQSFVARSSNGWPSSRRANEAGGRYPPYVK